MNVKKPLIKIISIFTIALLIFVFAGKIVSGVLPAFSEKESHSITDADGAWGDARSDFQRNGLKAMWISYIELQTVDFSNRESFTADIKEMFTNCKNMG